MLSRLTARKCGLLRPTQSLWMCFRVAPKSSPSISPTSPTILSLPNSMSRFLIGPNSRPERRKLPFFSDLHHEISRSWKQPFSSRPYERGCCWFHQSSGFCGTGLYRHPSGRGHTSLPPLAVSGTLMEALLPTKSCRTTSALIGKS